MCRYGVTLVGIKQDIPGATIQLNPGARHTMQERDVCFYMSITKEENSQFILAHPNDDRGETSIFHRHGSLKAFARSGNHQYSKVTSIVATVGQLLQCHRPTRRDATPFDDHRLESVIVGVASASGRLVGA